MTSFLNNFGNLILPLSLGVLMLISWRIGVGLGERLKMRDSQSRSSKFDDVSMALLGLLMAFTFGISISKYDQRRLAVVADSNAIGDFYNCASLLKEPVRTELRRVIREYVQLRVHLTTVRIDDATLEDALHRFEEMQSKMVALVNQALRDGTPIAVPLTNTLNELTSNHASRLAAVRDKLPMSVLVLLCVSSIIAAVLVCREQGLAPPKESAGTLSFIILVVLAMYTIIDLNQPDKGLITISQEPMVRLYASMPVD